MADRIVQDLSDARLRSGFGPGIANEFLQMNSMDISKWDDDFLSGVLTSSVYTTASAGTSAVSAAVLAPVHDTAANQWGNIRLVTGSQADTGVSTISLGLQYLGDYNAVLAVRYRLSSAAEVKLEIGFRDSVATTTPTVNALDTPSYHAGDGCCWVYDTDATSDVWQAQGVKAGSAATGVDLTASSPHNATTNNGALPIADVYQTMVVALMEDNAYFMRYDKDGGKQGQTIMLNDCITGSVGVAPCIWVQTRDTNSVNLDIDFIKAWQLRRS
jgi:hypothetical protein